MSYSENDAKLSQGINDFAAHVEQYAKIVWERYIQRETAK